MPTLMLKGPPSLTCRLKSLSTDLISGVPSRAILSLKSSGFLRALEKSLPTSLRPSKARQSVTRSASA